MNLKRFLRYYYIRFKRLQGSPSSVALGSAIGAAVGVTPTLPLHTILVVGGTLALRANVIAGLLMSNVVNNPLTMVPLYYLAWKIGSTFFPGYLDWEKLHATLKIIQDEGVIQGLTSLEHFGWHALEVMLTGGLALALPVGLITYVLVFILFTKMRKRRQRKHLLNNQKRTRHA